MVNKLFIIFCVFSLLLSFSLASALDWRTFGNDLSQMHQNQYVGMGQLDVSLFETNISVGYEVSGTSPNVSFQPINVNAGINGTETGFIFFPYGSYIRVYDSGLNLLNEFQTGTTVTQIDVQDYDGDGDYDDIATIIKHNNTLLTLKIIEFDKTDNSLTQTYEFNLSTIGDETIVNGIRNQGNEIYFATSQRNTTGDNSYNLYLHKANTTDLTSQFIFNSTWQFDEPLNILDFNNDGKLEFMTFNQRKLFAFQEDGTMVFNFSQPTVSPAINIHDAKFFHPISSNIWKVAILRVRSSGNPSHPRDALIDVYNSDMSLYNNESYEIGFGGVLNAGGTAQGRLAIADADSDGLDDIYIAGSDTTVNPAKFRLNIYDGDTLNLISTNASIISENIDLDEPTSLTIGDIDGGGTQDFIFFTSDGRLILLSGETNSFIHEGDKQSTNDFYSCIPADINVDGSLEILCAGESLTQLFSSSAVANNNSRITVVAYDPSTTIEVNTTLFAFITAVDDEGDSPLYYRIKCSNAEDWTNITTISTQSCFFSEIGQFNVTVGTKDPYHSTFDIFSQVITVTQTGEICDNDGICEAEQGETYINCPADCPAPSENVTQVEGGIAIPTQIVDSDDFNKGLLPEIYFGTLAFFSRTLQPFILLIFLILFVMIIMVLGLIIKKIAKRSVGG